MRNENLAIPLIITAVLLVSSIVPIPQIVLVFINSFLLYIVNTIIGADETVTQYVVNSLLSIATLISFYYSNRRSWKVVSSIAFTLFMMSLLFYATDDVLTDENYYYLSSIIYSLAIGFPLLIVGIVKRRKEQLHITRHRL